MIITPEAAIAKAQEKGKDPVKYAAHYYTRAVALEAHPDAVTKKLQSAGVVHNSPEWKAEMEAADLRFREINSDKAQAEFVRRVEATQAKINAEAARAAKNTQEKASTSKTSTAAKEETKHSKTASEKTASASKANTKTKTSTYQSSTSDRRTSDHQAKPNRDSGYKNSQQSSASQRASYTERDVNKGYQEPKRNTANNPGSRGFSSYSWDSDYNYMRGNGFGNFGSSFKYDSASAFKASAAAFSPTFGVFERMAGVNRYQPSAQNVTNVMQSLEILQMYSLVRGEGKIHSALTSALGQIEVFDRTVNFAAKMKNSGVRQELMQFAEQYNPTAVLDQVLKSVNTNTKAGAILAKEVTAVRDYYANSIKAAQANGQQSPNIASPSSQGKVISAVVGLNR